MVLMGGIDQHLLSSMSIVMKCKAKQRTECVEDARESTEVNFSQNLRTLSSRSAAHCGGRRNSWKHRSVTDWCGLWASFPDATTL